MRSNGTNALRWRQSLSQWSLQGNVANVRIRDNGMAMVRTIASIELRPGTPEHLQDNVENWLYVFKS